MPLCISLLFSLIFDHSVSSFRWLESTHILRVEQVKPVELTTSPLPKTDQEPLLIVKLELCNFQL